MPKSILNPEFKYVPASKTDIRKTFKRVRREQAEEAAKKQPPHILLYKKVSHG
jgi:hypothetical protein